MLLDPDFADLGFTTDGILVVFRGKPSIADYVLIEIPHSINTERYKRFVYNESPAQTAPMLLLIENDHSAQFHFSSFSNLVGVGTYTIEDNVLRVVLGNGNHYVFHQTDDGFVFDASTSTPIPSYRYEEGGEPLCPVPDGAVFKEDVTTDSAVSTPTLELDMPEAIYDIYSSYDGEMTDVYTKHDAHTVRVATVGDDSEPTYIKLNDAQIYHLNKLYAAVTDFSEQDGPSPTDNTIRIKHDGKSDSFYYTHAKQAELNLYVNALMEACHMSPIGLNELYGTDDVSSLSYTSVYRADEQGTTDMAFQDGVLYCQSLKTENGEQLEHLDRLVNGEWERLTDASFETLGLQNNVTYPLYERIGKWILFSNAENAIFLMDTTQNTVYDMNMTLVDWRKVATDNQTALAFLSAIPTEQNDTYAYEIRLYDLT